MLLSFVLSCSFTALLMFGCGPSKEEMEAKERAEGHVTSVDGYDVIVIDGCEYLEKRTSHGEVLTHKGNCKNKRQH